METPFGNHKKILCSVAGLDTKPIANGKTIVHLQRQFRLDKSTVTKIKRAVNPEISSGPIPKTFSAGNSEKSLFGDHEKSIRSEVGLETQSNLRRIPLVI